MRIPILSANAISSVVSVCLLALASAPSAAAQERRSLSRVKTVVLDPGHGGDNYGALSFGGVYEKDIVLEIALKAKALIEQRTDAVVILTRDSDRDLPLTERIALANESGADVFISLHCNSSFARVPQGIETFVLSDKAQDEESRRLSIALVEPKGLYASANDAAAAAVVKEMLLFAAHKDAKVLASLLQPQLVAKTRASNRGVRELPIVVLRGAEMPAAVVELGFLSHPVESENLASSAYQVKLAGGIMDAIVQFDNRTKKNGKAASSGSKPAVAHTK